MDIYYIYDEIYVDLLEVYVQWTRASVEEQHSLELAYLVCESNFVVIATYCVTDVCT